ncbi:hypothetical protein [Nocardia sp. NPDC019395]
MSETAIGRHTGAEAAARAKISHYRLRARLAHGVHRTAIDSTVGGL